MKYLLIAIINIIYGVLMLLTLSSDTPAFFIVVAIGSLLTILGLAGFVLWVKMVISSKEEGTKDATIKNWFSLVKSFDIVLIIGILFRALIIQPYIVDGISMEPNFHDKEILLVDKLSYDFRDLKRGEPIIFHAPPAPGEDYIKRVIAVPGETVVITNGKVYINGMLLNEPYLKPNTPTVTNKDIFRQTMGPGQYFVMGDNRSNSSDSREWGALPRANVVGRSFILIYPFKYAGFIHNQIPQLDRSHLLKDLSVNIQYLINI